MKYIEDFDRSVNGAVAKLPNLVRPFMLFASIIGSPVTVSIILLLFMGSAYRNNDVRLFVGEAVLLVFIPVVAAIKILTRRARPETMYVENMKFKTYSFPSGHAYASLIVFGLLAFLSMRSATDSYPGLAIIFLGLSTLVGVSRIYLGAHFPSDVIGGWILGALVLLPVIYYL